MEKLRVSLIVTVFNEQESIERFLNSVLHQTISPKELVIVDGGSTDETVERIKNYESRIKKKSISLNLIIKKGNRSVGRNEAVRRSSNNIIACSDAGNILDKNWLEKITGPFKNKKIDVVAGYYKGLPKNNFQKSLIPYVLVMPDKVNPKEFLPATRSIAFKKSIWEKVGGFDEKYSHNEDYVFGKKLKKINANIFFAKNAIVNWIPRKNIKESFIMFYRFAYGDIEAKILRPKVFLIFLRYVFALFTILAARFISYDFVWLLIFAFLAFYSTWAVSKNYKYIRNFSAAFYLPFIQFLSDFAVLSGSLVSLASKLFNMTYSFVINNKISALAIFIYTILVVSVINWGLPNSNHPFTYHMDEWHQLQSVRNLFTYLSPNMEGSANGPVFHFGLSGIYIGVLSLLGLVNPFAINSSLMNLDIQNNLFIYLRLSTLFFALGTVITLIFILKKYLNTGLIFLPVILFLFSPIWISLSNYFKYDIALLFWITLSILTIFRFADNPNLKNYLIAGVFVALSVCTKISALPILIVYFLAYIMFKNNLIRNIKYPVLGVGLFIFIFLMLGIPDILLGTGDYFEYFHSNLVRTPLETFNYKLGVPYWVYLFTNQIPTLFGFVPYLLLVISILFFLKQIFGLSIKKILTERRNEIFLLLSFLIFALSLIPMKLFIINRSLVVLPFAILFIAMMFQDFVLANKKYKKIILVVISSLLIFHFLQGLSWVLTKYNDPREVSSFWINENIEQGSKIGIENVPIYQFLPDNLLSEYYMLEYNPNAQTKYKYEIISKDSEKLPEYIILTNVDIDSNYFFNSSKKELISRIEEEGYKQMKAFYINRSMNELFTTRLDFYISLLAPIPNIFVYKK